MQELDLDELFDKGYYNMCGVKCDDQYTFFYDETNNCRKFWVRKEDNRFNVDYNTDFVIAGVCFDKNVPELNLNELVELLHLQKNTKEVKFNRHFSKKEFLDCMNNKRIFDFLRWIDSKEGIYIHYFNVNNLYYTIVEILDSITNPHEIEEFEFDYFDMKATLYDSLSTHADVLQEIMVKYKYPNITKNDIANFCHDVELLFPREYDRTTKQKYLVGCLRRASEKEELFFFAG